MKKRDNSERRMKYGATGREEMNTPLPSSKEPGPSQRRAFPARTSKFEKKSKPDVDYRKEGRDSATEKGQGNERYVNDDGGMYPEPPDTGVNPGFGPRDYLGDLGSVESLSCGYATRDINADDEQSPQGPISQIRKGGRR